MPPYHTLGESTSTANTNALTDPRALGPYPGTVAVTLWGLDTIKTKGESVAILLALVGAEPLREVRCALLCSTLLCLCSAF